MWNHGLFKRNLALRHWSDPVKFVVDGAWQIDNKVKPSLKCQLIIILVELSQLYPLIYKLIGTLQLCFHIRRWVLVVPYICDRILENQSWGHVHWITLFSASSVRGLQNFNVFYIYFWSFRCDLQIAISVKLIGSSHSSSWLWDLKYVIKTDFPKSSHIYSLRIL